MRVCRPWADAAERRDVDDSAGAGFLHEQGRLLAAEERGFQIYAVDEIPVGFGDFQWIFSTEAGCVIYQAIEGAELVFDFVKQAADFIDAFQICAEERSVAAFGCGFPGFLFGRLIVDGDAVAFLVKA